MIFSYTVDNFPLYKEGKQGTIQNCFRIDIKHQILGII